MANVPRKRGSRNFGGPRRARAANCEPPAKTAALMSEAKPTLRPAWRAATPNVAPRTRTNEQSGRISRTPRHHPARVRTTASRPPGASVMRLPLPVLPHLQPVTAGGHAAPPPFPSLAVVDEQPAASFAGTEADPMTIGREQQRAGVEGDLEEHAVGRIGVRLPSPDKLAALEDHPAMAPRALRPAGEEREGSSRRGGTAYHGTKDEGQRLAQMNGALPLSLVPDAAGDRCGESHMAGPLPEGRRVRQELAAPRRIVAPVERIHQIERA